MDAVRMAAVSFLTANEGVAAQKNLRLACIPVLRSWDREGASIVAWISVRQVLQSIKKSVTVRRIFETHPREAIRPGI